MKLYKNKKWGNNEIYPQAGHYGAPTRHQYWESAEYPELDDMTPGLNQFPVNGRGDTENPACRTL